MNVIGDFRCHCVKDMGFRERNNSNISLVLEAHPKREVVKFE